MSIWSRLWATFESVPALRQLVCHRPFPQPHETLGRKPSSFCSPTERATAEAPGRKYCFDTHHSLGGKLSPFRVLCPVPSGPLSHAPIGRYQSSENALLDLLENRIWHP